MTDIDTRCQSMLGDATDYHVPSGVRKCVLRGRSSCRVVQGVMAATLCAFLLTVSFGASAQGFYDDGEKGWFWYNEKPLPEEQEKEEKPEPPPKSVAKQEEEPEPEPEQQAQVASGPKPLSTAWFKKNLEKYLNRAIDNPTPENVEAYYRLQRIGLEKAQVFSEVAQQVVTGNPELDNLSARPTSGPAAQAMDRRSFEAKVNVAKDVWETAGLAYFYEDDCVICEKQADILARLAARTSVEIMPVSMDGSAPPGPLAQLGYVEDEGQSEMLKIDMAPALYLLKPPKDWYPIADGYLLENDIYDRIVETAYREGWIDQQEYDQTRPINRQRVATSLPESITSLPEDSGSLNEVLGDMRINP